MNNKDYFDKISYEIKKYKLENNFSEDDKFVFMLLALNYFENTNADDVEIFDEYLTKSNAGIDGVYRDIENKILTLIVVDYNLRFSEQTFIERVSSLLEKAKNLLELKSTYYEDSLDKNSLTYDLILDIDKRLVDWNINIEYFSNLDYKLSDLPNELTLNNNTKIFIKYYLLDDFRHYMNLKNETLKIDVSKETRDIIQVFKISQNKYFSTYLGSMKADFLANIYDKYGPQLLNYNVRAYLKKSQRVNKGIIETLTESPGDFVAFNNGLSTVATSITFKSEKSEIKTIKSLENWQIVNGGQTTASIKEAREANLDLKNVVVPFKLTILNSKLENNLELIQYIAEYSNTQTVIRMSDNLSNDPVYRELDKLSREHSFATSDNNLVKWFFERLNGQYHTEMIRSKNIKNFEKTFPKELKFNKSLMAKAIMSWEQRPAMVSQGNERNFAEFNDDFIGMFDKINSQYYRNLIGLMLIYTECDKIIKNLKFAFKQNVLTYTIAKLSYEYNYKIDFIEIASKQKIPKYLIEDLVTIARLVSNDINNPPSQHPNVSMWARKDSCWDRIKRIKVDLNKNTSKEATRLILVNPNISIYKLNYRKEEFWKSIIDWNDKVHAFTGKPMSMLYSMKDLAINLKIPSNKQKSYGQTIFLKAVNKGFKYD
jgi:hypothetical protein